MKTFSNNKKAYFDYFVEKTLECSIILYGYEVKGVRAGRSNLKNSFCTIDSKGIYSNFSIADSDRLKTILMTKKERNMCFKYSKIPGYSIIPLDIYQDERTIIKVKIGICKGKKQYDKREILKEKEMEKNIKDRYYDQ